MCCVCQGTSASHEYQSRHSVNTPQVSSLSKLADPRTCPTPASAPFFSFRDRLFPLQWRPAVSTSRNLNPDIIQAWTEQIFFFFFGLLQKVQKAPTPTHSQIHGLLQIAVVTNPPTAHSLLSPIGARAHRSPSPRPNLDHRRTLHPHLAKIRMPKR